jgi:hypothetical protein
VLEHLRALSALASHWKDEVGPCPAALEPTIAVLDALLSVFITPDMTTGAEAGAPDEPSTPASTHPPAPLAIMRTTTITSGSITNDPLTVLVPIMLTIRNIAVGEGRNASAVATSTLLPRILTLMDAYITDTAVVEAGMRVIRGTAGSGKEAIALLTCWMQHLRFRPQSQS